MTRRAAFPHRAGAASALAIGLAIASPASLAADGADDDADEIWECAAAINVAESKGMKLPVTSDFVIDHFVSLTGGSLAAEDSADAEVRRFWTQVREQRGQSGLEAYVLETAQDCADLYVQAEQMEQQQAATASQAPVQRDLNALGTLSAASLRAYVDQTGDPGAVADYLVYHYPYGKDLFQPNEDGDFLGELIVKLGKNGVRGLSDEAVYAIATKHYWQYNPPATRLIFDEYMRRLRANKQTQDEGQRWAERAAADRARQAQQATAKPVGSLGKSCEVIYRPAEPGIAGSRIVKCR